MPARKARAPKPELRPTLGPLVCDWIETYLCHGPGDVQGEPLELDDEYRAFIWRAYELYPKGHARAGRRVYQRAFLSRPKGRAKSELAGAIACVEALGPVRFDGWDRYGRPVGKPITSPYVRCFATEEGQAGNTFDNCYFMLSNGSAIDEYPGLDVGLTRINLPGGGSIEAVTASARSKDGGKDTFDVFDETHLWTTPELHRLHATVTRNLSKRQIADGWALETSTMYGLGEGSVAEATHSYAQTAPGAALLFDHKEAPPDTDIEDDDSLRAALKHVYGPAAAWMNIEGIIQNEFRDPAKSEADNRRYWLNQPVKLADRFVDPAKHAKLAKRDRRIARKTPIVIGFDGSLRWDATALVAWTVEDVPHRFTIGVWERPPMASRDWRVPRDEVDAKVANAFAAYDVRRLVCDPYGWWDTIERWTAEFGEDRVLVFETNQPKRMSEACGRYQAGEREGRFTHDADQVVDRHLFHCVTKETRYGSVVVKQTDSEKIDAAVATIIGYDEVSRIQEEEPQPGMWTPAQLAALAEEDDDDDEE